MFRALYLMTKVTSLSALIYKEQYYLMRVTKWTDHSRDAQEETHKCFYFHSNIRNAVMEKLRSEEWCKTLFQYDSDKHFKKLPTSLR